MKPLVVSAICVFLAVDATSASAQWRPGRPYRGLFSGPSGQAGQELNVQLTVGAGWDDDVIAQATGVDSVPPPDDQRASMFAAMNTGANYSYIRDRLSIGASYGSSRRLYASHLGGGYATHSGGVGAALGLGRRTTLNASQHVGYQPFVTAVPFPVLSDPGLGEAPPARHELATVEAAYFSYGSSVSLSHQVSRRGSASVSYTYNRSDFSNVAREFSSHSGAGRYSHELGKGLSVRTGYGYTETRYRFDDDTITAVGHAIDVGLDFTRALSLSRRTKLGFGTGATAVEDNNARHYLATGYARLTHEIGRSWQAALSYDRSVQYLESFPEPYLSNGLSVGLGGLISPRVSFTSSIGAASGAYGLSAGTPFDAYTAHASVNVALCQYASMGGGYTYYRYFHQAGTLLDETISPKFDRQSVGVYVSMGAPIFHRTRRR